MVKKKAGRALIAEVDATSVGKGEAAFWWLGQQGFIVKTRNVVLYFDPFLSALPGRQVPPLLEPGEVRNADFIFGSHDHADHIDRTAWPALAAASPRARLVVPDILRARLARELGIPAARFLGVNDGKSARVGGIRVTGIAAAHELLSPDPRTGRHAHLGFVVEADGCVLYHAGDTCIYEGLETKLRRWKLDLAFLPINGRDARRLAANCIGNMTYQEAADLAGALQPGLAIPAHFDMFAMNSEDPLLFAEYMRVKYPALAVHIPEHARRGLVQKAGGKRIRSPHRPRNRRP